MKKFTQWVGQFTGKPWYLLLVAFLAGIDHYILIVPTDVLLISAVLSHPRSWVRAFLLVASGSALGSLSIAWFIQKDAEILTEGALSGIFQSVAWQSTERLMQSHGTWMLAVISGSFLPQQPAVAIAALANMSLTTIFLAVWLGRCAKYAVFAWCASYAPQVLRKTVAGRKVMGSLDQE